MKHYAANYEGAPDYTDYTGEIYYCDMCDNPIHVDDYLEAWHHVPGLGYCCDSCYVQMEDNE